MFEGDAIKGKRRLQTIEGKPLKVSYSRQMFEGKVLQCKSY